ncbi:hypothetical protein ACVIGB_005253 [Bradyrhizobium sp. USDA 4341]
MMCVVCYDTYNFISPLACDIARRPARHDALPRPETLLEAAFEGVKACETSRMAIRADIQFSSLSQGTYQVGRVARRVNGRHAIV